MDNILFVGYLVGVLVAMIVFAEIVLSSDGLVFVSKYKHHLKSIVLCVVFTAIVWPVMLALMLLSGGSLDKKGMTR